MRSSIEGLNQEIEGLVLKSSANSSDEHQIEDKVNNANFLIFPLQKYNNRYWIQKFQYARYRDQITPEGHRAPLAELFRANRSVNSVNTQTPATDIPSSSYSSGKYLVWLLT